MPNIFTYMDSTNQTHLPECESFHAFFDSWLVEQNQYLEELVSASREIDRGRKDQEKVEGKILHPLIVRVVKHYEDYYRVKSRWAKDHILSMFSPSWRSSFEDAFLWIGGWRPSMTFHLLYSKLGLQIEARLAELLRGLGTGDLGDLSPSQLNLVNGLQRETITEEKEITEKYAKLQETLADTSMVELSHVVTELMREEEAVEDCQIEAAIALKEKDLVQVMQRADDLRLKTLKEVVNILTPLQALHFLIAAAELHLRIHDWGKQQDAIGSNKSDN